MKTSIQVASEKYKTSVTHIHSVALGSNWGAPIMDSLLCGRKIEVPNTFHKSPNTGNKNFNWLIKFQKQHNFSRNISRSYWKKNYYLSYPVQMTRNIVQVCVWGVGGWAEGALWKYCCIRSYVVRDYLSYVLLLVLVFLVS